MTESTSYTAAELAKLVGCREDRVLQWLPYFKDATPESIDPRDATYLAAVATYQTQGQSKGKLEQFLRSLLTTEPTATEWMAVRFPRHPIEIVEPPLRINVVRKGDARPLIFDPVEFLERRRV